MLRFDSQLSRSTDFLGRPHLCSFFFTFYFCLFSTLVCSLAVSNYFFFLYLMYLGASIFDVYRKTFYGISIQSTLVEYGTWLGCLLLLSLTIISTVSESTNIPTECFNLPIPGLCPHLIVAAKHTDCSTNFRLGPRDRFPRVPHYGHHRLTVAFYCAAQTHGAPA